MNLLPIVFEDGFETGDTTKWDAVVVTSGEHVTVDSVSPIHGAYSLLSTSENAGPDEYAMVKKIVSPMNVCYARGYFRVNGGLPLPNEGDRINLIIFYWCSNVAIGKSGGVDQFQLRVSNVTGTPTWIVKNTGIKPEIGRTYCVELVWRRGDRTELYIDGQKVAECLAAEGMRDRAVDDVRFGMGITVTPGHTGLSVSTDSCAISDTYIGPISPPTIYFEDDFETGAFKPEWSLTKTEGETASVTSIAPFKGRFHADFECDGLPGTAGEMSYAQVSVPSLTDCYVRQYILFTKALPPSGKSYVPLNLRSALASGYALAYVYVSGGATPKFGLYWVDQAGAHYSLTDVPVQLNRWYCIEVHVKVGAGDGAYEFWIDGTKVFSIEGVDNLTARTEPPYLGGPVNYVQTGERWASAGSPAHGVYVDEFVVADGYIGPLPAVTYTLTVATTTGGDTNPKPGVYTFSEGTSVTVTAVPAAGFVFSHWVLDGATRTENPITVLMDKDHTLTAYFTAAALGTLECRAFMDEVEVSASVKVEGVGTYTTPFAVQLAPGDYKLTATYAGQTLEKTVTIVAGETATVEFRFVKAPLVGPLGIWTFPVVTWIGTLFPRVAESARTIIEDIKKRWRR